MIITSKSKKSLNKKSLIVSWIKGFVSELGLKYNHPINVKSYNDDLILVAELSDKSIIYIVITEEFNFKLLFHTNKKIDINMLEYRLSLLGIEEFNYG